MNVNELPNRERGSWSTTPKYRSWPTDRLGLRVVPGQLLRWLRERSLAWYCFCQDDVLGSSEERSCQIGLDIDCEDIGAFCHFSPSRCGFNINLTRVFKDSIRESEYRHLDVDVEDPTLDYEAFFQAFEEDQEKWQAQVRARSESGGSDEGSDTSGEEGEDGDDEDMVDLPTGAFLEGYCGAICGETTQLAATFATHIFQRRLNSEREAIREEKRRKIETLSLGGRWGVTERELKHFGLTPEDLYDESLLRFRTLMLEGRPLVNGVRVHPRDMVDYLWARGLVWGCYCSFGGQFRSCRIGFDGQRYRATCWSDEPAVEGCNFNVDLDRAYAKSKQEAEYPHLAPSHIDLPELSRYLAKFEMTRSLARAHEAVSQRPLALLVAKGWLGQPMTNVKQLRLRPKNSYSLTSRFWAWWARLRARFASMEIGIDGV
ncbi:hypothetical protein BKA70DRAFT_1221577 [Coprinopsis sp. MPI-PUGE-AT-0042]|nr:hypothetical protein BKA70DRAFT_1221577 [Coprinopsis sp. MPI-PUGE-AT-0042]